MAVAPLTEDRTVIARRAYDRFGKGRHRAGLNLGDCCAYALARYANEPLLFKGDDCMRLSGPFLVRDSSQALNEDWLSPERSPASRPSTLMSSSSNLE